MKKIIIYFITIIIYFVLAECNNCNNCQNGKKCIECKNGYTLMGEKCVEGQTILDFCEEYHEKKFGCKKCIEGYTPTMNGLCMKCTHIFGPDCLQCDQTNSEKCIQCQEGAVLTREGACIFCNKYFRKCEECDGMTMRCTKCSNNKTPQDGFC